MSRGLVEQPLQKGKLSMNDFTGMKVGRLQVIERNGSRNNMAVWKCKCDCGNIVNVMGRDLKRGHTKSCGCLHKEEMIKR